MLFHYPAQRESFEMFCIYAERFSALIPISFLTGFYVSQVVTRWWTQFMSMPWPDKFAFKLVSYIPGTVRQFQSVNLIKHLPRTCSYYRTPSARTSGAP